MNRYNEDCYKKRGLSLKDKFYRVNGLIFAGIVIPLTAWMTLTPPKESNYNPICQAIIEGKSEAYTVIAGIMTTFDLTTELKAEIIKSGKCTGYTVKTPEPPVEASEASKPSPITIQEVEPKEPVPYKIGASDKQNEMIAYAWEISQNQDFIYLIESESGWVLDRVSGYNSNGHRDWGLCQINSKYHSGIINSPQFQANDWRWELDTCLRLYNGGTKFYGADRLKSDKGFYEAVEKNFGWN